MPHGLGAIGRRRHSTTKAISEPGVHIHSFLHLLLRVAPRYSRATPRQGAVFPAHPIPPPADPALVTAVHGPHRFTVHQPAPETRCSRPEWSHPIVPIRSVNHQCEGGRCCVESTTLGGGLLGGGIGPGHYPGPASSRWPRSPSGHWTLTDGWRRGPRAQIASEHATTRRPASRLPPSNHVARLLTVVCVPATATLPPLAESLPAPRSGGSPSFCCMATSAPAPATARSTTQAITWSVFLPREVIKHVCLHSRFRGKGRACALPRLSGSAQYFL